MNYIVCHYAEIGIKGKNRKFFEEKLINNIKAALNIQIPENWEFVKRISGRILIKLTNKNQRFDVLKNIFGIAYFAFAVSTKNEIEKIQETALTLVKNKEFKTFRISAKRSDKKFPLSSQEINEKIGESVVKNLKKKVNLKNPEITIFIEVTENNAFLYLEKIKGPGGLPANSSGKGILLLSGGIDSPVAAYFVKKRGVETIYLHFHSYPFTSKNSIEKAKDLVKILNKFSPMEKRQKSKLILIPFAEIQKKIVSSKIDERLRVVLYRRFMMRIAEKIAETEKASALITGESIGQVASQTLENIKVIEEAIKIPVLRPLCGFDKEEIIAKAREIDTFETSIIPCDDTCSLFAPKNPKTKANLKIVKSSEKKLNVKNLIAKAIIKSEIVLI
mgnify:CR=1 FL=1